MIGNDLINLIKINKLVKKEGQGYISKFDVECPKELPKKHSNLPFLSERLKIRKVGKLIPNLQEKQTNVKRIKKSESSWL